MKKLYVATAALLASTALSMPAFAADSTEKQIQMLKEQLRVVYGLKKSIPKDENGIPTDNKSEC